MALLKLNICHVLPVEVRVVAGLVTGLVPVALREVFGVAFVVLVVVADVVVRDKLGIWLRRVVPVLVVDVMGMLIGVVRHWHLFTPSDGVLVSRNPIAVALILIVIVAVEIMTHWVGADVVPVFAISFVVNAGGGSGCNKK